MKRTAILFLALLNVALILLVISEITVPNHAMAQPRGSRSGDYSCVTAKTANQSWDVLYVLDRPQKKLHAYYPIGNARQIEYQHAGFRDLEADFKVR